MKNSPKPPAHLSEDSRVLWRFWCDTWTFNPAEVELVVSVFEARDRKKQIRDLIAADGLTLGLLKAERDCETSMGRNIRLLRLSESMPEVAAVRRVV